MFDVSIVEQYWTRIERTVNWWKTEGGTKYWHKKGRSKAETIEVKIERRCSSKEHGDYRKQLRGERLNGDSGDAFSP